jgi:CYTH domain-containing protein
LIENEVKFVLHLDSKAAVENACGKPSMVLQGYLPGKGRIRRKTRENSKAFPHYTFNYKIPLNGTVFELEKEITRHEFDTLWELTETRLVKYRYTTKIGVVQWDIDYFVAGAAINFALAEAEMPEDMIEPDKIPKFLRDQIIYAVPRDKTDAFSSRKLACPSYRDQRLTALLGEAVPNA